jgi:hypothetical protein
MNGRSWTMILAVLCGFATAFIALFADVTESTFLIRVTIGLLVGALVGLGFDTLLSKANSLPPPTKGRVIDFTVPEATPTDEFVPMDYQKAARVVQQMVRDK